MMILAIFLLLLSASPAAAEGWDDFSNNLATDLAPFLSLFGEQITKQYLSESITRLDYFIFAMAPIGILTALVSAIRVCGSPSLRAFVGRAQEGAGNAEAELCSSTSRDVCELYNSGGIARVFGRPKILEVVVHRSVKFDGRPNYTEKAQISTFIEYVQSNTSDQNSCWRERFGTQDRKSTPDPFAPNLSLNVGIRRKPWYVFLAVAMAGFVLQAGVIVFALATTYYLRWRKDDRQPDSYACPFAVVGIILVCGGSYYCAYLIGNSTQERFFRWEGGIKTPVRRARPAVIYWLQPGRQIIGDQTFDAFAYTDRDDPLDEYIISQKGRASESGFGIWSAVVMTILGFVMQFVGLRALHSSISVAQLGAMVVMSIARAALRMQRLKPTSNLLSANPDQVVGHELDWLAVRIGEQDVAWRMQGVKVSSEGQHWSVLWRFGGTPMKPRLKNTDQETDHTQASRPVTRIMDYRARLAELTGSIPNQVKTIALARSFDYDSFEVRQLADRLVSAIESTTNKIFSKPARIKPEWRVAFEMSLEINCNTHSVLIDALSSSGPSRWYGGPLEHGIVYLQLRRNDLMGPWKLHNKFQVEAMLGLWAWSLQSDPVVETRNAQDLLTTSLASNIQALRIVATDERTAATLLMWHPDEALRFNKDRLAFHLGEHGPGDLWEITRNIFEPSSRTPYYLREVNRNKLVKRFFGFFGWNWTGHHRAKDYSYSDIWWTETQSPINYLCAQEIFGSFVAGFLDIMSEWGGINIHEEEYSFQLENDLVSDMTTILVENNLGTRQEAFLCVAPPLVPRLVPPSAKNALTIARKKANEHRKGKEWDKAQAVLRWAWGLCKVLPLPLEYVRGEDNDYWTNINSREDPVVAQAVMALGELYRSALADHNDRFGMIGVRWLVGKAALSASKHTRDFVDRYKEIARRVERTRMAGSGEDEEEGKILDERTKILYRITIFADRMSYEDRHQAILAAAQGGWVEVALALLELDDVDPNHKDRKGRTALSYAAEAGHFDFVDEMVKKGSRSGARDSRGRYPIHYAAEAGHTEIVAKLHEEDEGKLCVNEIDFELSTPLWLASSKGHAAVVRLLVEIEGVDLNTPGILGTPPIYEAVEGGHLAVVVLLLGTKKVNVHRKYGPKRVTALWLATYHGHESIVRLLLDYNDGMVDPNVRDDWRGSIGFEDGEEDFLDDRRHSKVDRGMAPFHLAAQNGNMNIVQWLLETNKINLDERDLQRRTALHLAAQNGHQAVVRLLLARRCDPDIQDYQGHTPLERAALNGHLDVLEKLLYARGQVAFDSTIRDALCYAAQEGHHAVVERLVEVERIDLCARGKGRQTPLRKAAENGHKSIVNLLLEAGGVNLPAEKEERGATITPTRSERPAIRDQLVRLLFGSDRVDPDTKYLLGRSLLFRAAEDGQGEFVRLLLDTGLFDPNEKIESARSVIPGAQNPSFIAEALLTVEEMTPLWIAVTNGHEGVARQLLATGVVDVNVLRNGQTILKQVKGQEGYDDMVNLLEECGAKLELSADEDGNEDDISEGATT